MKPPAAFLHSMNKRPSRALPLVLASLLLVLLTSKGAAATTTDAAIPAQAGILDYTEPTLLTGTLYETGSDLKKALFTFRRTATRSNATVHALIEYRSPGGALAARERMVYEANKLVSCELEELQTGAHGSLSASSSSAKTKLLFAYTPAKSSRTKTGSEDAPKEALVNDMIAPFIRARWDSLSRGSAVKFRYVALERAETVGFKLVKEAETTWRNKPALRLKMEPTSLVIAALVDPLYFTVEKNGPHRVLEYVGRTTPKIERNGKWKDLDAVTVYNVE